MPADDVIGPTRATASCASAIAAAASPRNAAICAWTAARLQRHDVVRLRERERVGYRVLGLLESALSEERVSQQLAAFDERKPVSPSSARIA